MKRVVLALMISVSALGLAGCIGDTDPASNVLNFSARLNAHGHTNNGPAYWWWEYSTSQSAVENGQGIMTLRRGPAESSTDVKLSDLKVNDQVTVVGSTDATGMVSATTIVVGSTNILGQLFGSQTGTAGLGGGARPSASPTKAP